MIEFFKTKPIAQDDLHYLEQLNPWWEKGLNKLIAKNKIFLSKFGMNPNDYIPFDTIQEVGYVEASSKINNYLNFFKPKLKQIIADQKLFSKFEKRLSDYVRLLAIFYALNIMIEFNKYIDHNMSDNKMNALVRLTNNVLIEKWERFKTETRKSQLNKESIDTIFAYEKTIDLDKYLFSTLPQVKTIAKHAQTALKAGKIEQRQFLYQMYLCYVQQVFNQTVIYEISRLLNNVKKM